MLYNTRSVAIQSYSATTHHPHPPPPHIFYIHCRQVPKLWCNCYRSTSLNLRTEPSLGKPESKGGEYDLPASSPDKGATPDQLVDGDLDICLYNILSVISHQGRSI